jgi:hypothetical protein
MRRAYSGTARAGYLCRQPDWNEDTIMNNTPLTLLKGVLWLICACHIAIGAAIMSSGALQERIAALYGAQVQWTPQFVYILRPLGAFMLVLGLVGMAAAVNPLRYRVLVFGFAGLLLLRVLQRVLLHDEIQQAFGVGMTRTMVNAGFFLILAALLLVLLALASRKATANPG